MLKDENSFKSYFAFRSGVTEVQADVDTKVVNVLCEDAVDEEVLHSALKNWGEKANKSVELVVEAA